MITASISHIWFRSRFPDLVNVEILHSIIQDWQRPVRDIISETRSPPSFSISPRAANVPCPKATSGFCRARRRAAVQTKLCTNCNCTSMITVSADNPQEQPRSPTLQNMIADFKRSKETLQSIKSAAHSEYLTQTEGTLKFTLRAHAARNLGCPPVLTFAHRSAEHDQKTYRNHMPTITL